MKPVLTAVPCGVVIWRHLTAVRVPGASDEAAPDLARAREGAVRECRNARHRLKALLLRNGIPYAGKSNRYLLNLKLHSGTGAPC